MLEEFYDKLTARTGIARTIDPRLEFAARYRSQQAVEQVGYDADGGGIPHPTATERMNLLGWPSGFGTAELATWNYLFHDPVQAAVDGLMGSPDHRAILMEPAWDHWGAGIYTTWKPGDEQTPLNARNYFLIWLSIGVPRVKAIVASNTTDALSASYIVAKYAAPLLLVNKTSVPPATKARLQDLDPSEILVVGGTAVVDGSVEAALSAIAPVRRIAGADRYATAVEVSKA